MSDHQAPTRNQDYRPIVAVGAVVLLVLAFFIGIATPISWYWDALIDVVVLLVAGLVYGWVLVQIRAQQIDTTQTRVYREAGSSEPPTLIMRQPVVARRRSRRNHKEQEPSGDAQSPLPKKRIPRFLKDEIRDSEEVQRTQRLHYLKLVPSATIALTAFLGIGYVASQPESERIWMVGLVIGYAILAGFPIVRRASRIIAKIKWWHVLIAVVSLALLAIWFRQYVGDVLRWIGDSTIWLLEILELDSITLENAMSAIAIITFIQFLIRAGEWWRIPIVITDQRLIFSYGLVFHRTTSAMLSKLAEDSIQRFGPLPFVSLLVETQGSNPLEGVVRVHWCPVSLLKHINTNVPAADTD